MSKKKFNSELIQEEGVFIEWEELCKSYNHLCITVDELRHLVNLSSEELCLESLTKNRKKIKKSFKRMKKLRDEIRSKIDVIETDKINME